MAAVCTAEAKAGERAEATVTDYALAATVLAEADYILFAGGAGLSAECGLKTFANAGTFADGLSYDQVASLDSFAKRPGHFYRFWGGMSEAYAKAPLHEGYTILNRWRQRCEAKRTEAASVKEAVTEAEAKTQAEAEAETQVEEEASRSVPAATFAVTSNVDGYFVRCGFPPEQVAEIHGNVRTWQCGGKPTGKRFPLIERERCGDALLPPPDLSAFTSPPSADAADDAAEDAPPPACPRCGDGRMRPHVYLFGDGNRFANDAGTTKTAAYREWTDAVVQRATALGARVAIVEVGSGLRVPTIRKRCEELLARLPGGQGALIRINPDHPDQPIVASPTHSFQEGAVNCLVGIEAALGAR